MKNPLSFLAKILCILAITVSSHAQSLPQIQLKRVFPKFQIPPRPDWLPEGVSAVRAVWMCQAPDDSGRFFIVMQTGVIYVLKKGSDGGDAKVFLDIQDRHPTFQNEDGLLSIAFHPGFKTNGLFYIYYTQENKANDSQPDNGLLADRFIGDKYPDIKKLDNGLPVAFPYRSVVSEFKVSATDPDKADMSSERVIFEVLQPFWNHKGGELGFGPDGYLYFGLGDGGRGDDPFGNAQNTASYLGKILRIDVNSRGTAGGGKRVRHLEYGIPDSNPFVKEPDMGGIGAQHEIFAYGFRNPWRWSFDRQTGDLWVGDVGQDLWEEVDLVTNGGDYGWSVREGTHHFKPGPPGAQYVEPVMEYPHKPNMEPEGLFPDHSNGLCIIGGYVYRGKQFPSLNGIYIYGDYNLGTIWGFRYDRDAHKITGQGMMHPPSTQLINSFAEDNDGELYVLMQDGGIYQITAQ